jgi:hypothetical protein
VARVWAALVARGLWIARLSEFSIVQEGDVATCDARRAAAVEIIAEASARATHP